MSVEGAIETHALMIVDEVKSKLGAGWNNFTDTQRASVVRAAKRITQLEWEKRVNGKDVSEDLVFVKTTIDEFRMAGEVLLYDAFWEGVVKAFEALGSFLVGAGASLIPGLGTLVEGIDLVKVLNGS